MNKHLLPLVSALLLCSTVYAAGDIRITGAHARPTVAQQTSGAAYLTLENTGSVADRLLDVSSPVAQSAAVHTMRMDGDVMRMREAGPLLLAPAATLAMAPGAGYHIMLTGLKQPLQPGQTFPLTLSFAHAGRMEATVVVDGADGKPAAPAR